MTTDEHKSWVEELVAQFEAHPDAELIIQNEDNSDEKYVLTDVRHEREDKIVATIGRDYPVKQSP